MPNQPVTTANLSRRHFLKTSGLAAGGLMIAFQLPACSEREADSAVVAPKKTWAANGFVHIASDNQVTILVNHQEMGQGVYTALPMLVAEELDVDWKNIVVELAPVTPEYHHARYKMRITGGSTSVSSSWEALRTAGATAKALLVTAAAKRWDVDPLTLQTNNSQVTHPKTGRTARYGSLVEEAEMLPIPGTVQLKDPKDFTVIGTDVKRIEGRDKVTGQAQFSLDIKLPGMLTAVVVHPPVYGNTVKNYQVDKALAYPGVIKVKQISTGVAVIAKDFWTAKSASELLSVEWAEGPAAEFSTSKRQQYYRELAEKPGPIAEDLGDVVEALAAAENTVEGLYEVPYLAHACMEPLSCTAQVTATSCELWLGTQAQTFDQNLVAELLDIKPEQVIVNGQLMGGGFGRRVSRQHDYVGDAVEVAKGETVAIKTIWTRENDIQGAYYRPQFTQKVIAGLDGGGLPTAWWQRLVGQSISINSPFEGSIKNGIDYSNLGGAAWRPYAIQNRRIELHGPESPIPVHWWRGICYTQNTFVAESFMDEIAHAGKQDPLALRQKLLADHPRHLGVLALVAEKSGWGKPLPKGHGHGIAVESSQGSYVAQVAEVSITANNQIKVHRVTCAIDCGIAVNPRNIKAQVEGSIIFGLSAALHGEITIEGGVVQQSNFHDYPVLRMDAMPEIDVHIVESAEAPSGVGEPGVPPIAPAVANAIFAATGKRVRKLPIQL